MPVVKINAIEVPPDAGPELEKRFANRAHAVDGQPGFLGFQLLRPIKGEDRYFVVTTWASEEDFQRWRDGRMPAAHAAEQGGQPARAGVEQDEVDAEEVLRVRVAHGDFAVRPVTRPAAVTDATATMSSTNAAVASSSKVAVASTAA